MHGCKCQHDLGINGDGNDLFCTGDAVGRMVDGTSAGLSGMSVTWLAVL
jgi:hypothetical protein